MKEKKKKEWKTAKELMAELNADPEYVEMRARQDAEFQKRDRELKAAQAPLLEALRQVGHPVDSVWDLVNSKDSYPAAVPVLLEHLCRPYPDRVREGIGRALGVREAAFAWPRLLDIYEKERSEEAREGIAVAIGAIGGVAGPSALDDVMRLLNDPRNGDSRVSILQALKYIQDPRVESALQQLMSNPLLAREVRLILRRRTSRGG